MADAPVGEAVLGPGRGERWALCGGALAALLLAVVPPLLVVARRQAVWEAVQFCLFALLVPALTVLGAPWSLRTARTARLDGDVVERVAFARVRHRGQLRAFLFVLPFCLAVVVWRTPWAVNGVVRHPGLLALEAATLVPAGALLWLELVSSPPLEPRSPRGRRIILAALAMWTVFVMAFLVGFSRSDWYRAFGHRPGHGISLIADQQLMAGVLWLAGFVAFVPVEFANIVRWLRSGDDLDAELHVLLKGEPRGGGDAARDVPEDRAGDGEAGE